MEGGKKNHTPAHPEKDPTFAPENPTPKPPDYNQISPSQSKKLPPLPQNPPISTGPVHQKSHASPQNPPPPLSLLAIAALSFTLASDSPSAYEMLERFNFPKGILPEGVKNYVLRGDGRFEVALGGDCEFRVEGGYLLKYKKRLSGRVESGALKDLRGVSVRVLLVSFRINEVVRSDAVLCFHVGPLSASFPVSSFRDCPRCRCGFNCWNAAALEDSEACDSGHLQNRSKRSFLVWLV